jgi:hypothetical protein
VRRQFELDGRAMVELGVSAAAVVEDLDVFEDGIGDLDAGIPALPVEEFDLHRRPERSHHRVLERIADGSERGHESRAADLVGERPGGELHAVIGVHDRAALDGSLLDGHVERVHDEVGVLDGVDRQPMMRRLQVSITAQQ